MKVITKLFCPFCGKEMNADIHAPEDGAKWNTTYPNISTEAFREMDNWLCLDCLIANETILFTRDDIKEWI